MQLSRLIRSFTMSVCFRRSFLLLLIVGGILVFPQAQPNSSLKKNAEQHFQEGLYTDALQAYLKLTEKQPKSAEIQYKLGCCYYELSNFEKALSYFRPYLLYRKHEDKALFYTANSLHQVGRFTEALHFYKLYLKAIDITAPDRNEIKRQLLQCSFAQKISNKNAQAIVVSMGDKLNSPFNDYLPLQHPDDYSKLYFSSNRQGATAHKNGKTRSIDIWVSQLSEGNWQAPELLSARYNSDEEDLLLAFPDNGYQILYFRGFDMEKGQGKIDNFKDGNSEALEVNFAPLTVQGSWTGDYYLFSDSLVLFASDRPNNYGGIDLYYAVRRADGQWSEAINLGPEVNSIYDEKSPFLAIDGRCLYFSSSQPKSMGGFDVYKSVFSDSLRIWSEAENLGVPVNSAGDDLFFRLDKDGLRGYVSSERNGGKGGMDMYSVYFRQYLKEQMTFSSPKDFADVLFQNKTPILFTNTNAQNDLIKKITRSENTASNKAVETNKIFALPSIFYDGNSGELSAGSEKTINNLKRLLSQYKDVMVVLTVHTDDVSPLASNLFFSVQQAEKIALILSEEGIENQRVLLRGCAQNYPIARNYNFDGSPNPIGRQLNRRIDIDVYNANHLPISIENNRPMVSSVMTDTMAENYSLQLEGLCYKVQLLNTPTLFAHPMLEQIKNGITEKKPSNPSIAYCVGLAKHFDAILSILDTAKEMGFSQAKVVPYINGFPISEAEAQSLYDSFPDLEKYLEYIGNR